MLAVPFSLAALAPIGLSGARPSYFLRILSLRWVCRTGVWLFRPILSCSWPL
jgi:hypothetical protein